MPQSVQERINQMVADPAFGKLPESEQEKILRATMSAPVSLTAQEQYLPPGFEQLQETTSNYPATQPVPGLFSGSYSGPHGSIAPGETTPHAVGRMVLGGVGRGLATIPQTMYQGAKDILTPPSTLGEGLTHPVINPLGYVGKIAKEGFVQQAGLAEQAKKEGRPVWELIHGSLAAVPAAGPWIGKLLESARGGDIGAPFEFGVATATGRALGALPKQTMVSAKARSKISETRASNLAAAAETGGGAPKGILVYEDVARPLVDDFRSQAIRDGIGPQHFEGRQGYLAFRRVTSSLRQVYDDVYGVLRDRVADRQISSATREAANSFAQKLTQDAQLIDEITNSGNTKAVRRIQSKIASAKTIGELDTQRKAFNDLATKYFESAESKQAQAPILKEAFAEAGNSIRDVLYREIGKQYSPSIPEASLRNLQKRHGAALSLDNLAENSVRRLSSVASEEMAKPSLPQRIGGLSYRATLASPKHAIAGLAEKILSASEVKLFNTRMKRVLANNTAPLPISAPRSMVSRPAGLLGKGPITLKEGPSTSYAVGVSPEPVMSFADETSPRFINQPEIVTAPKIGFDPRFDRAANMQVADLLEQFPDWTKRRAIQEYLQEQIKNGARFTPDILRDYGIKRSLTKKQR